LATPHEWTKIWHEVWANPDQLTNRFSQRLPLQTMADRGEVIKDRRTAGATAKAGACYNFGHFPAVFSAGSARLPRVPALWL
jgi:hypothetical protein